MIKNRTKDTVVCANKKILSTMLSKTIGLMFSRKINDLGLIFTFGTPRRIDLHMMFVFYPIDLVFLDERKKVIEIKENFLPFTLYYSRSEASFVLELPFGSVRESKTETGDTIEF